MRSAGIIPYRHRPDLQVLIAHPGGPFWANRNEGWWSPIKGLVEEGEDPETTAAREFTEETGWTPPPHPWLPLGEVRLRSGKAVVAWAAAADYDPASLRPGSFTTTVGGRKVSFPEIDQVAWVALEEAERLLNPAYRAFLDRLLTLLNGDT